MEGQAPESSEQVAQSSFGLHTPLPPERQAPQSWLH
jgi:hypothetical protein